MRFASPGEEVWVLGEPERGPTQFSAVLLTTPEAPEVVFVVGQSDPAVDWPAFHPGPLSAATGHRPLTCELRFAAPAASEHGHLLALDLFASTGPCPQLEVDVNGRKGVFHLAPVRASRADVTEPSPIAGWVRLQVSIATDWLVPGENSIRLTTVAVDGAEPDELARQARPFFGHLFGSGFQYGRVGLYRAAATAPELPTVRLLPLPLFVEEEGQLRELVDLLVDAPGGFLSAQVVLRLAGDDQEVRASIPGVTFGQARARISVPAQPGPCEVTLDVDVDGVQQQLVTELRPARRWTVHVMPHVHLDVGYTDLQGKVIELHSRNVERAVDILADNPDYAFSIDGAFILRKFFGSRSDASARAAREALRSGRISSQAFHTLFLTGLASLEECYRSAYYSADLHDELGLAMSYANLTDVPSYSWAIPSILADLGVDAFMGIQNHTRAGNEDSDIAHLLSPVRWQGPDGQQVLAFFADCYGTVRRVFADPPTVTGGADGLCRLLGRYEREDYLPADIPLVGTHADNEDLADGEADLVGRWNERYAFPRLRYSTIADYFDAVRPLQDRLPLFTGDGGSYWEDGVGSAARTVITYRRAQTMLPTAEALLALLADRETHLASPRVELDRAWQLLEFGCEHTWTAYHAVAHPDSDESTQQTAWKVNQVESAAQLAKELGDRAMSQLAEAVQLDGPAVLVFNPLSWPRDAAVEVELSATARLTDSDGASVPTHVVDDNNGLQRLRFIARDVPALGYRVFPVRGAAAPSLVLDDPSDQHTAGPPAEAGAGTRPVTLKTGRYAVRIEAGRVIGLTHLPTGRQLVDQDAPYALAELLYVSGGGTASGRGVGSERSSLSDYDWSVAEPELEVIPAQLELHEARRTPWGLSIEMRGHATSMSAVTVELHLHDAADDVDIVVHLDKQAVLAKESVYVAFPFALDEPVLRYDRQQGWVDPSHDSQPGACVEWFAMQYAAALSGADATMAWSSPDAPLFTSGDIVRGRWPRSFRPPNGWLFSWVMNNYWWTNFPASQQGEMTFRYRFRPMPSWSPVETARLGRAARTPLLVSQARPLDKTSWRQGALSSAGGSLAELALPDNVMAGIVGGRAGDVIVRLQEISGNPGTARLDEASLAGRTVHVCTAAERRTATLTPAAAGDVKVQVGAHAVVTLSLARSKEDADD